MLGLRQQQRLQGVLRDQLIRLQWQTAISAICNRGSGLIHGWVFQMHQRRFGQRCANENIHRHIGRICCGPNSICHTKPTIYFHGAWIGALHLGQIERLLVPLNQGYLDATLRKIERAGQTSGASTCDENLGFKHLRSFS